jgi:hypothetical protein
MPVTDELEPDLQLGLDPMQLFKRIRVASVMVANVLIPSLGELP